MCPITLDWFLDPVVVASGYTYSRHAIEEQLELRQEDPITRMDLTGKPVYPNIAMKSAVEHYRLNYQKYNIID
jgi:hypothetical protein